MEKKTFFSFRKGDLFAIAFVALLAVGVFCAFLPANNATQNAVAQVWQNGSLLKEMPLQTDAQLEIDGDYHNLIVVRNGEIGISDSDCPGSDCVRSAWISQPGRSIVCLPNRVEIRIAGQSDVDFVVG